MGFRSTGLEQDVGLGAHLGCPQLVWREGPPLLSLVVPFTDRGFGAIPMSRLPGALAQPLLLRLVPPCFYGEDAVYRSFQKGT